MSCLLEYPRCYTSFRENSDRQLMTNYRIYRYKTPCACKAILKTKYVSYCVGSFMRPRPAVIADGRCLVVQAEEDC